ncbi:MAG TPA: hypothetical protein VI643_01065 [Planctomycetota bacterium]|nr:hypothetical protein [Planctomycetota bacterium]
MKRILAWVVPVWLAASAAAFAQPDEELFGFGLTSWYPRVRGDMRSDTVAGQGTTLDLPNTLDVAKAEDGMGVVDAWIHLPSLPITLSFSAYGGRFEERSFLASAVTFAGAMFGPGPALTTGHAVARGYTLAAEWLPPILNNLVENLELRLIAGIHYVAHDIRMIEGAVESRRSVNALVPHLGVRATWIVYNQVEIEAAIRGFPEVTFGDHSYQHVDMTAEFRWIASDNFKVGGGYRMINLMGLDESHKPNVDHLDIQMSGFFVSAYLVF